jgi:DNA helicase HerA-like ATPase
VTLNLSDMHKGHMASHSQGVSVVTDIGGLLVINAGGLLLVLKVQSLSFVEPREAHRAPPLTEPLRSLVGRIVGRFISQNGRPVFIMDTLSAPALGSEVFPLDEAESAAIFGTNKELIAPIHLGDDLRGGRPIVVGLSDLISRHVAVLGSSGAGKSCFTAAILQQIVRFPHSRTVIFDINGEYETAFDQSSLPADAIKITRLGLGEDAVRIPYYALGREGLQRLLMPSEKTQRPALNFAIENLRYLKSFLNHDGAGLSGDGAAVFFDDCRAMGADQAAAKMDLLRSNQAPIAGEWPNMRALSAIVADSYSLTRQKGGGWERNSFNYGNVAPLITRINRFAEDPMFRAIVNTSGGPGASAPLNMRQESTALVERVFGGDKVDWRVHVIDLRIVTHDLMPFVLGALLELYAFELFARGQEHKFPTLLVLEEAHHYLRPIGTGEEAASNSLAYERLAKEGRKFGLALWLSTQRPSEISPTVLSQCSNWICFRLVSDSDLAAVQSASEWADRREVRRIAGLARQTAIAFGGSLQIPALLRARKASPLPKSEDAHFDGWNIA